MALAETVFRLEQLDSELEAREAALRDLRRRAQKHPELDAARALLDRLTEKESAAAHANRSAEADLADLESRIKKTRERMYSGAVVDPRELSSLEKELQHWGTRRDELEEQCLQAMDQLDELRVQIEAAKAQVSAAERDAEQEKPRLAQQEQDALNEMARLRADREPLLESIDPRTRYLYESTRKSMGHAVSHVTGGVCAWCHVSIPAKDLQHARGNEIVTCPHCRRILYVGP
jgi:predicted  nucleic acid-binding Zn-ribbon protein